MKPDDQQLALNTNEMPLPEGWVKAYHSRTNRFYYVDHKNKKTSWLNPNDRFTKQADPQKCKRDELPFGWEKIYDPRFGTYYANHIDRINQWQSPVPELSENQVSDLLSTSQHHYSNSRAFLEQNFIPDNNITNNTDLKNTPTTSTSNDTFSKNDTSIGHTSDGQLEKSATTSSENITRNYSTVNSKYDAEILDIMDNRFGRGSSQSVEV